MKRHRNDCGICEKGRLMDNERVLGCFKLFTPTVAIHRPAVCEQCEGAIIKLLAKLAGK